MISSQAEFDRVVKFRDAAIADGWSVRPTYVHEDVSRASSLEKDGFRMMILTRLPQTHFGLKYPMESSIAMWGPDGLSIRPPKEYNMEEIKKGLRTCYSCGKTDVDTVRYSFAGRCCKECLPEMRRKHEYPGWCD